jgi:alkaline phosphatase
MAVAVPPASTRGAEILIKPVTVITLVTLLSASQVVAQTVYPIDRAEILSGARFDFKVEFPDRVDQSKLKVTVNGEDHAAVFGRAATFIEREDDRDQSALMLRDVELAKPGPVVVVVSDGT